MIDLFPEGFEEIEHPDGLELVAYTDPGGEERLWQAFGTARAHDVEAGWEERWRTFHQPVLIAPLWIGPPWLAAPPEAIPVVIDPGLAFGTGAHPTTRLCLQLLLELERGSLLDLGCGSGVLAIAAAKLGYTPVVAVDVESRAVEAARANAEANAVAVDVRVADVTADELPPADVAVANIALPVLETLAGRLRVTWLVTSGYLLSDRLALPGFLLRRRVDEVGWVAELYERG
jgi:ribosomal protein L11 methyltransferase